jgi:hypothetical protein
MQNGRHARSVTTQSQLKFAWLLGRAGRARACFSIRTCPVVAHLVVTKKVPYLLSPLSLLCLLFCHGYLHSSRRIGARLAKLRRRPRLETPGAAASFFSALLKVAGAETSAAGLDATEQDEAGAELAGAGRGRSPLHNEDHCTSTAHLCWQTSSIAL